MTMEIAVQKPSKPSAIAGARELRWRAWQLVQQIIAGLALAAIMPMAPILYLLVKADSRGPFLYSQERPGLGRRRFTARKIRTMTVGADQNPMLARSVTSDSPEVTRVGRYLRDLKLDELPQLWNVLRGDMVFVGPRPIAPALQEFLEGQIPGFNARLSVHPGLTSLGQICIEENESVDRVVEDWSVRFEAERHYLSHRSVTYDLVIIGMTVAYCFRKLFRRLPLPGVIPVKRTTSLLVVPLTLLLTGCAETLDRKNFTAVDNNVFSRSVPWQEGVPAAPIVEHETVSVDTLPRGEHDPVYRLGPGDRLEVNVFGEPVVEALVVQVDGAGDIQLPMLDNVRAAGLSLGELQTRLKTGYAEHFMEPWVVVQLREPLSRPIYLLGEFNQPGIVHMTSETTVIQALGAGRGLTDRAYTRGSRLIRDDKIVAVDINALLNRGRMDQNVWLQPNDTIFVPGLDDLRIFVLGAIASPGALEVTNGPLTLADAITRGGGPRRGEANLEEVRVIRTHSPVSGELFVVDFTRITEGLALDMPLEPGDIVYLPVNGMGGWNDVIEAISPTLLTISRALDPFVLAKTITDG